MVNQETVKPGAVGTAWRPLLGGALRQRALATVQDIVAALPGPSDSRVGGASLAGGQAGLAVLCTYLALAGCADGSAATRFLRRAAQTVSSERMAPSLFSGFTGVAWATTHVRRHLGGPNAAIRTDTVDQALVSYLDRWPRSNPYDLIDGLVGLGVYGLERLPDVVATALLERVIDRLEEAAQREPEGLTWFTPPHLIPASQRARCPHGYYNLGVAHGVPGVIALLGQACAAGVATSKTRPLLDGVVAWLLSRVQTSGARSAFPAWAVPGAEPQECRLAWCYGDAGVAAALLLAARCVGEPVWERAAIDIARRAAQRAADTAGVTDAGLCHGAAGVAHVFNRIFQATGDPCLASAALCWFEQTLQLRRPGNGIAGFSALTVDERGQQCAIDAQGILTGAAGIALALLAAATPVEPAWDRLFLVSIPPRASDHVTTEDHHGDEEGRAGASARSSGRSGS